MGLPPIDKQIGFLLYVASKELIKKYTPLLKKYNLTYTGYIVLVAIDEKEVINIKTLGDRLYLDSGTLTPLLKKLEEKGVKLISHKEKLDTSTPSGKLMVTMLGAIYEFERANLLERQKDGIAVAKKEGKYKGRKKISKPDNWQEVYSEWVTRKITAKKACELLNLKTNTFYNFVRDSRGEVGGNVEFSATQLNDGDVGTQAKPSTTGAKQKREAA